MPEPSLTELASAGQSMEVIPTIGVNNQQDMVRTLNQQAQFKAQNDWNKYLNFQKNLGDFYQNVAEVEKLDVMDEDRPELQKDAAELYKKALENPGAFSGRNPDIFGELESMRGGLLAKATESKQNNLFDKANRQFLAQNNDLNNEDNKKAVEQFRTLPLGSRKAYTLDITPVFDANTFSEGLKAKLTQTSKVPSLIGGLDENGKSTPGDAYIRDTTTETIPYQQFKSQWNNAYGFQDDKNGQPIRKWANKQYETLPDDVKKKISPEQFWDKVGDNFYGSTKDEKGNIKDIITKTEGEIKANPNYLKQQTIEQQERDLKERKRHNKVMEAIGWTKANDADDEEEDTATGIILEIGDKINAAMTPENRHEVYEGGTKGSNRVVYDLSDPEVLKMFGTIDKDGKTANAPDVIRIDEKTGNQELVYYQKEEDNDGNLVPKLNKTGGYMIKDTKPINQRTWARLNVKSAVGAAKQAKVNEKVQEAITKNGGVVGLAKKIKSADGGGDVEVTKTITEYSPAEQSGIQAVMKANGVSEAEAIQALIKAGKLK